MKKIFFHFTLQKFATEDTESTEISSRNQKIFKKTPEYLKKKHAPGFFRHSRENGNPAFSIRLQVLDSACKGMTAFANPAA
jgi:hypothetical protein